MHKKRQQKTITARFSICQCINVIVNENVTEQTSNDTINLEASGISYLVVDK